MGSETKGWKSAWLHVPSLIFTHCGTGTSHLPNLGFVVWKVLVFHREALRQGHKQEPIELYIAVVPTACMNWLLSDLQSCRLDGHNSVHHEMEMVHVD